MVSTSCRSLLTCNTTVFYVHFSFTRLHSRVMTEITGQQCVLVAPILSIFAAHNGPHLAS